MDFIQEKINETIQNMIQQQESILYQRLNELDIEFDLEVEKQRRFKRLVCERQNNKQTWYYNDGSISGKRIITFESIDKQSFDNTEMNISIEYKYY